VIELAEVAKVYDGRIKALDGVSLAIGPGLFGLLGPNGAGKTTLMRLVIGLLRPTSGSIRVLGQDMSTTAGRRNARCHLGYLPQELGLYPDLTACEFLEYVWALKRPESRDPGREQVMEVLEQVGLADVSGRRIGTYSGGMRQRVGIAQALLGRPRLLILDEPTAGLDPEERLRLLNLLSDVAREQAVILSTHIVDDVSQRCRDLAVLHRGEIVYRGHPDVLIGLARGHVWSFTAPAEDRPPDSAKVVSLRAEDGGRIRYRVLGAAPDRLDAAPADPDLADGYLWLMHQNELESGTP
jgi:ABC-2 type transport system ATP-binding protein